MSTKSFMALTDFQWLLASRGVCLKVTHPVVHQADASTLRSLIVSAQRRDDRCNPPADGHGHQWRPGTGVVPISERYRITHP